MKNLMRYLFPTKCSEIPEQSTKFSLKRQSGQTFVEFVLLLASIVIVAFSFMRVANNGIADRWETFANIILEDENQTLSTQ